MSYGRGYQNQPEQGGRDYYRPPPSDQREQDYRRDARPYDPRDRAYDPRDQRSMRAEERYDDRRAPPAAGPSAPAWNPRGGEPRGGERDQKRGRYDVSRWHGRNPLTGAGLRPESGLRSAAASRRLPASGSPSAATAALRASAGTLQDSVVPSTAVRAAASTASRPELPLSESARPEASASVPTVPCSVRQQASLATS